MKISWHHSSPDSVHPIFSRLPARFSWQILPKGGKRLAKHGRVSTVAIWTGDTKPSCRVMRNNDTSRYFGGTEGPLPWIGTNSGGWVDLIVYTIPFMSRMQIFPIAPG